MKTCVHAVIGRAVGLRRPCALFLILVASVAAAAQSVTDLLPRTGPRGARVIVVGHGLDAPNISVTFASGSGHLTAAVVDRSDALLEIRVPSAASTGDARVLAGSTVVGTFTFTVAPDPVFVAVSTLAASSSAHALFKEPRDTSVDRGTGDVYVADRGHHQIRRVRPDGTVDLIAGTGLPGSGDGMASQAEFRSPQAVVYDAERRVLFVADSGNHVVRSIAADGIVRTLAGSGRPEDADGIGTAAGFKQPSGLALDFSGNLYVADTGNDTIRRVSPSGVVTTVAGSRRPGYGNGPALSALFHGPEGIAVGPDGIIFVADTQNHVIRRIQDGSVTTLAGTTHAGYIDGPASFAEFHAPSAIAIDDSGTTIYVADTKNHLIRSVLLTNIVANVTTVAGTSQPGFRDGAPLTAQFFELSGVDVAGAVYFADTKNDAIRLLLPSLTASAIFPRYGAPSGGTIVRVFGSGFLPGRTIVRFGDVPAPTVTFVSATEILATTPAGVGTVDVLVTTTTGSRTLTDAFTYLDPPTILSVNPASGAITGNQTITITGAGFLAGHTTVSFGGSDAAVTVTSPTTLTATTPQHASGMVDVTVTTPVGNSVLSSGYEYLDPPVIEAFSPGQGVPGTTVVIVGHNFGASPIVHLGGVLMNLVSATELQLTVTVPATAASGMITVETAGGTATTATSFVVLTYTGITVAPPTASLAIGETVQLSASGVFANGTTETLSDVQWTSSVPQIATVDQQGTVVAVAEGSATITATFASFAASATINVRSASPWPPDPSTIAPPVSATIFTPFVSRVQFLYEGLNALQRDMTPGAIVPQRVCVIKGKVTTPAGEALPGVRVSVHGSPNLGYAVSRADGMFDLVMNGGGDATITYQTDGYFPVQRTLPTAWEEFIDAPTVAMTQADAQAATIIATGSQPVQVARASRVTDLAGSRQATLIFPAGVQSSMITSSGTETLATLTVRATEYTVGSSGPAAMPGSLPAASGYTYAVELSADEAIAAGASEVRFTKPVAFYVENFLNFPVGGIVPVGYYDRLRAAWVPSNNGRVIKITAINATTGLANIDFDGNGQADSDLALSAAGIDTDERRMLASIYTPGVSLWRMSTTHFSPWDCNWPYGPPLSAKAPGMGGPMDGRGAGDACTIPGSIIDCQNQSLGEVIPIAGTPYSLSYNSAKTPGFKAGRTVRIPVTGAQAPADVKRIELEIAVAGQFHKMVLAPLPNTVHEFEWSGLDVYGRKLIGVQDVKIRIGNTYDAVYQSPAANGQAFGRLSGIPLTGSRSRQEVTLWQEQSAAVEAWPTTVSDAGGWFLTQHHLFDVSSGTLFLGSGDRVKSERLGNGVSTAGGVGCQNGGYDGDGGLATKARIDDPRIIATAPDGTIYFGSSDLHYIRKIKSDGTMATVARLGTDTGDGIPAASARVSPRQLAVGPDGALYFTDTNRVRRIRTEGIIETVAGSGAGTYSGDGGPALQAGFQDLWGIDVATDGTIFVTDNFRIRAIGTDGMIRLVGGNSSGSTGDGGPATSAFFSIGHPGTLKVGPDGSIYVAENGLVFLPFGSFPVAKIRKISPSGIVSTIAGGFEGTPSGDGGFATAAIFFGSVTIDVANDGTIFTGTYNPGQREIRKITTDGIVSTIVKASGSCLGASGSLALAPNGTLYVADTNLDLIREVSYPGANYLTGIIAVPGANGELYVFDTAGRHLKTVDAVTGVAYATFSYDQKGKLASVTDIEGRLTRLSRDASGALTAVIAPAGQETTVSLDGAGYLAAAIGPGNIAHRFSTESDGLLSSYTNPRGKTSTFEFDENGRLAKDSDPVDGFQLVTRSDTVAQSISTIETAMGRRRQYITDYSAVGETRTTIDPSGLRNVTTRSSTGGLVSTSPDGTVKQRTFTPDPRFGIRAPLPEGTVKTPSGLTMSYAASAAVTLASSTDPLSVLTQTSTFKVNGKTFTSLLDTRTRKLVETTPLGRQVTTFFDDKNHVTRIEQPATTPVEFEYANGLLVKASRGTRATAFGYDEFERLDTITDATMHTTRFEYDTADRVRKQILPDLREIVFDYDANGNVTSIVPAGRPQHGFTFTATDQNEQYNPPAVSGGGFTRSTYNPDGQLTLITRADNTTIGFGYDAGGRIQSLSAAAASLTISYVPTTGNLASVTSTDGSSLTYAYDGSLMKSVTWGGAVTGAVSYNYDPFFRLASESVGTSSINYGYDDDGLLKSAGAMTITRHPANGRLTGTSLGAATDSHSYNLSGEISGYTAAYAGTPVLSFGYTRDAIGRIATISSRGYEYDGSGRLVRVTDSGVPVSEYDYDANGNRIAHRYLGGSTTAIYDDQDRLLTYGDTTYEYTANGDLKAKTLVGATTTFDYDAFSNLRSVQIPGLRIDYMVDGQNRRIGKRVNGVLVKGWLYADQLRIVAELDGTGTITSRFVYGSRSNVPDYMIKSGVTYRIISDHLGSPRLVVNVADGSVAQSMTHDEFGRVLSDSNPGFQPFGFAGGLYDRDTGLVRFGTRDYDPHVGRWTTKDPIGFGGGDSNLYAYVLNDPINLIDPMGTDWVKTTATISAGVGDGILETLSFGLWNGQAARSALGGSDQLVDTCSGSYKAARVAGTAIALAAYAGGAIPKSLTHFTTETGAMFIKGGGAILPSTGTTLFGNGVYAATFRTGFVPAASTVGVEVSGAGFMRIVPGTVFLKGGSALTGAWFGGYGAFANRDMLGSGCGCQ